MIKMWLSRCGMWYGIFLSRALQCLLGRQWLTLPSISHSRGLEGFFPPTQIVVTSTLLPSVGFVTTSWNKSESGLQPAVAALSPRKQLAEANEPLSAFCHQPNAYWRPGNEVSAGVMVLARYWTVVDGNDSSHSSSCPAVLAFSAPDHRAAGDLSREHMLFVIFKKREKICPKNVRNANSLHATVAHVLPGKRGGTEAALSPPGQKEGV